MISTPFFRVMLGLFFSFLVALLPGHPLQARTEEASRPVAGTAEAGPEETGLGPAARAQGAEEALPSGKSRVMLRLEGNRDFCVAWNEVEIDPKFVRPRQERAGPFISSFGYKYQISASRRGTGQVIKLMESPVRKTAYRVPRPRPQHPPGPRVATPKDLERQKNRWNQEKETRWMPENACTKLDSEYQFALAPGQYDFYLGFDLLLHTGQWVPLVSDYVSRVKVEEEQETIIHGTVDHTDGVRTVKLDGAETSSPSEDR